MITIDLICEACGEANPPGTEFCRNCNEFLAWDSATAKRQPSAASGSATTSTSPTVPVQPAAQQTVPIPQQPATLQTPVDAGYDNQAYDDQGYQQTYSDFACPYCNATNPPTRRFCVHCGYSFYAEYGTDPGVDWSGWTPQAMAARDREARKAYRRSLPPLYRWRRVIIAVVAFALFIGLGALISRNPVALASSGWHRLNNDYVTVAGVQARVDPIEAAIPGSDPAALLDGTEQEWTMAWAPTGAASACGAAPGTGTVIFTFPATQVRRIVIAPGLAAANNQRPTQARPATIGLTFDNGTCHPEDLTDTADQQVITIDSRVPVTQLSLGIGSAHLGGASTPQISLTEVWIQTYPSR